MCIHTVSVGVHRDGAFAEYVVIPETQRLGAPRPSVTPDLGAIFDPFGNAVHTALSFPLVGEDVLITGAGPIGLMAIAVARHVGARYIVVTDVSAPRLELARQAGRGPGGRRLARRASGTRSGDSACARASTSGWRCPAIPPPCRR